MIIFTRTSNRRKALISKTPDGRLAWVSDRHHDPDIDEDRGTDVWAVSGEQVSRSRASSALPPPALSAASTHPRYDSIVANGTHWRTLTRTATIGGAAVVLRVARSEDRLRAQLQEILTVLAFGLPLVAIVWPASAVTSWLGER